MSFAEQLEATWPTRFAANHPWSFPSLEVIHLLGIGRALSIQLLPLVALNAWLTHRYGQRNLTSLEYSFSAAALGTRLRRAVPVAVVRHPCLRAIDRLLLRV